MKMHFIDFPHLKSDSDSFFKDALQQSNDIRVFDLISMSNICTEQEMEQN